MSAFYDFRRIALARLQAKRLRREGDSSEASQELLHDLDLIAEETSVIEIRAPWLTLEGLRIIYELNKS